MIGRISQSVADKMIKTVEQGGSVRWGKATRISRDSLSSDVELPIAFSDIIDHQFDRGVLTISTSDGRTLQMSTSEVNFFPGYALMQRLHSG